MSRLIAAVLRKSEPMPPRPPAFETAAASSAEVHEPIGARMIGISIPRTSHRRVFNIAAFPRLAEHPGANHQPDRIIEKPGRERDQADADLLERAMSRA